MLLRLRHSDQQSQIDGKTVELLALPLIFQQFRELGRGPETA